MSPRVVSWLIVFTVMLAASSPLHAQAPPVANMPAQHHHGGDAGVELFAPRDASGTAWLPDETPMYSIQRTWGSWQVMGHGVVLAQFIYEPGDRHRTGGDSTNQVSSANWGMVMARRPLGAGRLGLRGMLSIEPWTVTDCGFLNLLASGEMCEGDTIHDRQHPHDLVMELAADYDRPLRGTLRWQIYGGLAGEPAIGPVAFPHRISAMPNPIAPISHHWLDSSHVTFGLVTTGIYDRKWKAEMSLFNGREPDEKRADLDLGPLDSLSGRFTFTPTSRLTLQVSAAHLEEAEDEFPPQPRSDVDRVTASTTYHRPLSGDGIWATTLAYGVDSGREVVPGEVLDVTTQALLLESSVTLHDRNAWFGRLEIVEKPAEDLHVHEFPTSVFTVSKLEGGYVRYFKPWKGMFAGIGGAISANVVPSELASRYSGRLSPGFTVFFTVRPPRHMM